MLFKSGGLVLNTSQTDRTRMELNDVLYLHVKIDRWMDGWMGGWVDGWKDRRTDSVVVTTHYKCKVN